jgi:hypothetical protein
MEQLVIEVREVDGQWTAELPEIPGTTVCGSTRERALAGAMARGLRSIAELIESHGDGWCDLGKRCFRVVG